MKSPCLLLSSLAAASALEPWMDLQATPEQRTAALVANLTNDEKVHYFHGSGSGYVGNVAAQRNGAIPAIKMNDGPQGFRDNAHLGTTTSWPSALAVSATWNPATAGAWGEGMGQEFFDKGANVQLGPGMCVARVPRNGRNFEYLSGEDPVLGVNMVPPVVKGIQSKGVIANAKHYVNNNQETNRGDVSENVDERTQFEIYYPPFEAASDAGVGSIMCSYNKIRNTWSCENPETLQRDLKERLGFKGWVMSDWGATHSTSINAGLDQEMPGGKFMSSDQIESALKAGKVTQAKIDDSVSRILTPMFAMGLFDEPWLSNNATTAANVTSAAHNALARSIAAEGAVLLNNNGVLPLDAKAGNIKIAVIGHEAQSPTVHGGGSGQVVPYYTSAPLDAIREALGLPAPPPTPSNCSDAHWDHGFDYRNTDGQTSQSADSVDACCGLCAMRAACNYFTFTGGTCWMKATNNNRVADADAISGGCHAGPAPAPPACVGGKCVYYLDGSDIQEAVSLAQNADVAIVFTATDSSEGGDRGSLSLDGDADKLIAAVAAANAKTVSVMVSPGAILTPWRDSVAATLVSFMPGQEYGHAIADVLFGATNPSGKLPLTLPTKENECPVFSDDMWPGINKQANYSEHMLMGYRCYDAAGIAPAFPFGHGLSYSSFGLSDFTSSSDTTLSVTVTNTGKVAGAEVVQAYLTFPDGAGEPPQLLKSFHKTKLLAPGASEKVTFTLNDRAVSIWDIGAHAWKKFSGKYTVTVGTSSRDPKALQTTFTVA